MRRIFRWIGWGLFALIVLIGTLSAVYRLRGPSTVQREALALMHKDYRPTHGVNAFPLLWFMRYDVSADELDARMAADVEAVRKRLSAGEIVSSQEPGAPLLSEPSIETSVLYEVHAPGCLAKIAVNAQPLLALWASHPVMLARAQAFARTDFYWKQFPADDCSGLMTFPGEAQRLWLSAFALQYVDGDHAGALAATCNHLGAWRCRSRGTNALIGALLTISYGDDAIHPYADMLAGLRADEAVPVECAAALRPIDVADLDRCAQMAGEFALSASSLRESIAEHAMQPSWNRAQGWLFFEECQSEVWNAEHFAAYCGEAAITRMLVDQPASSESVRPITRRMECVASLIGCVLADIVPAYTDYDVPTLDFAAHLRLTATLLWLRDHTEGSLSERFERRPQLLRSARHASGVDNSRGMLYLNNLYTRRETRFELPVALAQVRVNAAAPDFAATTMSTTRSRHMHPGIVTPATRDTTA